MELAFVWLLLAGIIASTSAILFPRPVVIVVPGANTAAVGATGTGLNLGVTGNTVFQQNIASFGVAGENLEVRCIPARNAMVPATCFLCERGFNVDVVCGGGGVNGGMITNAAQLACATAACTV